jgi:ABC-type multidrug transport system ATPase subunit
LDWRAESQLRGLAVRLGRNGGLHSLRIRKMAGLVPDSVGLYGDLSAFENLDFYGKFVEFPEARRKENIERFLTILDLWDKKTRGRVPFLKASSRSWRKTTPSAPPWG